MTTGLVGSEMCIRDSTRAHMPSKVRYRLRYVMYFSNYVMY